MQEASIKSRKKARLEAKKADNNKKADDDKKSGNKKINGDKDAGFPAPAVTISFGFLAPIIAFLGLSAPVAAFFGPLTSAFVTSSSVNATDASVVVRPAFFSFLVWSLLFSFPPAILFPPPPLQCKFLDLPCYN